MRRYTSGLTQAELATKHPMTDTIVAAMKAAGVVVLSVDHNTITTDIDTFKVNRGDDPRGGYTNRRAHVCATKAAISVGFPDGPKMGTTIKKFITDVRAKCVEIDAQDSRNKMLQTIRSGLRSDMDVMPNYVGSSLLVGPTCTLQWRIRVPLDKAADIAAQVAALLAANGIDQ